MALRQGGPTALRRNSSFRDSVLDTTKPAMKRQPSNPSLKKQGSFKRQDSENFDIPHDVKNEMASILRKASSKSLLQRQEEDRLAQEEAQRQRLASLDVTEEPVINENRSLTRHESLKNIQDSLREKQVLRKMSSKNLFSGMGGGGQGYGGLARKASNQSMPTPTGPPLPEDEEYAFQMHQEAAKTGMQEEFEGYGFTERRKSIDPNRPRFIQRRSSVVEPSEVISGGMMRRQSSQLQMAAASQNQEFANQPRLARNVSYHTMDVHHEGAESNKVEVKRIDSKGNLLQHQGSFDSVLDEEENQMANWRVQQVEHGAYEGAQFYDEGPPESPNNDYAPTRLAPPGEEEAPAPNANASSRKRTPGVLRKLFRDRARQVVTVKRISDNLHNLLHSRQLRQEREKRRLHEVGTTFAWGRGIEGQLGVGQLKNSDAPIMVPELYQIPVNDVVCGGVHSAALTEDGVVYVWGRNGFGQLGIGSREHQTEPRELEYFLSKHIVQIALGDEHSAAVSEDGQLFTWGRGMNHRLGHGKENDELAPRMVEALKPYFIIQVACGEEHTICLSEGGDIFTWGRGDEGQLGLGHYQTTPTPTMLERHIFRVSKVAAGGYHSAALTYTGDLYTWGWGFYGQLGKIDENELDRCAPKLCLMKERKSIAEVACGGYHTAAISDTGQLYLWGMDANQSTLHEYPMMVHELHDKKCTRVRCGEKQAAVITEDGEVFYMTFKWDERKQLLGEWRKAPSIENIISVSCGWKHMLLLVGGDTPQQAPHMPRYSKKASNRDIFDAGDDVIYVSSSDSDEETVEGAVRGVNRAIDPSLRSIETREVYD
eukprot:GFYU01000692.1.p1 GENE.GFYU01000692.1~~GFYU01000692.1.p1  ORF type:complete len:825 (+),score=233.28 GFYU01000692.1:164-2638(+)